MPTILNCSLDHSFSESHNSGEVKSHFDLKSQGEIRTILQIAKEQGYLDGHSYEKQLGNLLLFTRESSSHCQLCNRTHENDNTLMIRITDKVRILCRRMKGQSIVLKGNNTKSKSLLKDQVKSLKKHHKYKKWSEYNTIPEWFDVCTVDQPILDPFEVRNTLLVKARMGIGKSVRSLEWLASKPHDKLIIVFSFRRSWTTSAMADFANLGFVDYNWQYNSSMYCSSI